ncbi:MAG: translation initiation factor IF-2, partial [Bacteroides sp.]|nr:translation initiation factor IF-2 [Bacteroides sp.]
MTIRLNKVTRDLNVGITTAVEFLQKKGFTVEANPNTKITDEQFELLKKEFSTDKDLKIKSERFIQERQSKDRNKASVAIDGYKETQEKAKPEEIKTVVPEDARPKFKQVGKIDLDKLKHRPAPVQENVTVAEVVVEEKKVEEPVVVETPKPESAPIAQPEPEPQPEAQPNPQSAPEPKVQSEVKEEPAPAVETKQESKKEEMIKTPAPTP